MTTTNIPPVNCACCGKLLEASTIASDGKPKQGDISICSYCGQISKYDDHHHLVALSKEEMEFIKLKYPDAYASMMNASSLCRLRLFQSVLKKSLLQPLQKFSHN